MVDGLSTQNEGLYIPAHNRSITHKSELLEHLISDEELTMLQSTNQDNVTQIFWGALGASLGAATPALQELRALGSESFTIVSLIECIVFFVGICVAFLMGVFWFNRSRGAKNLAARIRNRTRKTTISEKE